MKIKRRICSVFLALCLCIGLMPMPALAADGIITTWNDLQAAIEGPETEVTVTISGDLQKQDDDRAIVIPAGKTVTLIGETGTRIIRPDKSENGEFVVSADAELTLQGEITVAGEETQGTPGDLSQANFIKVEENGKLHLKGALTAYTYVKNQNCGHNSFILCEGETTIEEGAALSGWLCNNSSGNFNSECAALVIKGANANLTMTGGEVAGNENRATSGSASGAAIQIRDGASFIMQGGSICDNTAGKQGCGGGVMIVDGSSSFEMTGGSIIGNSARYGAGVYLEGQKADDQVGTGQVPARFTMTGGSISQNILNNSNGSYGGGLYAQDAEVQIVKPEGATDAPVFAGNKSAKLGGRDDPMTCSGGAIYCTGSDLVVNGAVVRDTEIDSTNGLGGAIYLEDTKADFLNSEAINNQCGLDNMSYAGAFYIAGASDVTMNNMTITGNSAAPEARDTNGGAGAICISGTEDVYAKLKITDSEISNNMTGGLVGGAVYAEYADLSISDTDIKGNKAQNAETVPAKNWYSYHGGALCLVGSTVTLERVNLSDNQCADGYGGAIMISNDDIRWGNFFAPCNVTLTDCTLANNKAERLYDVITSGCQGGAIYVGSGTLNLEGNTVISDNAAMTGGAIVNEGTLNMQDGEITGNTATGINAAKNEGIGGGVANLGTFTMTGGKLYGNIAARGGNDFYNYAEKTAGGDVDIGVDDNWEGNHDMDLDSLLPVSRAAAAHGTFTLRPAEDFGFEGWFEDAPDKRYPENETIYTPVTDDTDEKYLTIGEPTVQTVTVTFQPGDHGSLSGTTSYPVTAGSVFGTNGRAVPTVNADSNYEFTGWLGSDGNIYTNSQVLVLTIAGNMTFTAQYKAVSSGGGGSTGGGGGTTYYILHYKSNGGTEYKDERYKKNTVVELDKVPTREGYTFTGWYADKELTDRITSIKMTSDKTVYAGWEPTGVPEWLNGDDHFAYVIGYTDGTVRPRAQIARSEVAAIFFRLLKPEIREEYLTDINPFDDVDEEDWYSKAVSTLYALDIFKGRTSTDFVPDAPITRAEFAVICARFDTGRTDGDSEFTDIAGHWAEAEIERAASLGWVQGDPAGRFHPDAFITRAEAMTMINRVLNRLPEDEDDLLDGMNVWPDNKPGDWYYLAVQEATNSHDFTRKGDVHEHWTKMTVDPDWSRYQ